jgi:hypothetical protein
VQQVAPDPIDHHPDADREEAHQLRIWPDSHDPAPRRRRGGGPAPGPGRVVRWPAPDGRRSGE